ncbi:MAG: hypothetical protein J07HQX50_01046, partial [Haloquadratum sp. J07HQX50]
PLPANTTREQVDIQASDFEAEANEEARREATELTESETSQPGFGIGVGLLALFVTIIMWRKENE